MAYTINLTNGNLFATVENGTVNTQSSMTLIGKNYAGYGQMVDDNFIHLLESGANSTPPGAPLTGQIWWDTTNVQLKVYSGTTWKVIGSATTSSTAPASPTLGDLWFDTVNQQLKVWNGSAWLVVGPPYSSGQGITGSIPATIIDTSTISHTVLEEYVGNTIVGIISQDPIFTPANTIPGFTTINPGYNLPATVTNAGNVTSVPQYWGQISIIDNFAFGANVQIATSLGVGSNTTPIWSGVPGEIRATNNITAFYTSDSRFKENVKTIQGALSKVECIGGKTFDWTDAYIAEHGGEDGYFVQKSDFGVIAQDVQRVFPQAVRTKEDGTLAVDYAKLSALSFAALTELNAKVDALIAKLGFTE